MFFASPIITHFHMKLEKYLFSDHFLNIFPCLAAHFLQSTAFFTNQNSFLCFAFHHNFRINQIRSAFPFLVGYNINLCGIGYFLMEALEDLLANDFRNKKPFWVFTNLIWRIERNPKR